MDDTGRIRKPLRRDVADVVFGQDADHAIDGDLLAMTEVDRAHLVMLSEAGVLADVAPLLDAIEGLRGDAFTALRGRRAARGLYLLYEDQLIATVGPRLGGALQTGRSRNDLNATVLRLTLREQVMDLRERVVEILRTVARRSEELADVVMPIYTHWQPALPVTVGHYLAGVACALVRDLEYLAVSAADLARSPLGAGAVGGTSFPIRPERTAALLGFTEVARNSIDAVASRDVVLRVLAAASVLGTTMSRVAQDLLLWTTGEFGFVTLPDEVVGSSSMMPQKRNPFLLEHVIGRAGASTGAFVAAAAAMHAAPFTNSAAVGTDGVRPTASALALTAGSVTMLRAVLEEAEFHPVAMRGRAVVGMVAATRLAEWLVQHDRVPYREAHHRVGELVTEAMVRGVTLEEQVRAGRGSGDASPELDPEAACAASHYGGGPGAPGVRATLEVVRARLGELEAASRTEREAWASARAMLDAAVRHTRGRIRAGTPQERP